MSTRATILRMQIRNDEALHEHYTRWAQGMRPGDLAPVDLPARVDALLDRLEARRAELAQLLSPAVTASTDAQSSAPGAGRPAHAVASHEESLAGSLVTTSAAQPGK